MRKFVLLAALATGLLRADTITYTLAPIPGGFSYRFTLANMGDTGGTLFDLFLSLPTDISNIDTSTIGTPAGWGDAAGGLLFFGPDTSPSTSFIEWAADFSDAFDLGIGRALSGFSFTATHSVSTPIRFALNGSTAFADAEPVAGVPELGTFTLLAPMVLLSAVRWRRRQRS
jgi:hypothetical protein